MVVKTTAIYIPLRTVLEKQYTVIRVEETKRLRVKETKSQKVEESKSFGVRSLLTAHCSLLIAHYYTPPQ